MLVRNAESMLLLSSCIIKFVYFCACFCLWQSPSASVFTHNIYVYYLDFYRVFLWLQGWCRRVLEWGSITASVKNTVWVLVLHAESGNDIVIVSTVSTQGTNWFQSMRSALVALTSNRVGQCAPPHPTPTLLPPTHQSCGQERAWRLFSVLALVTFTDVDKADRVQTEVWNDFSSTGSTMPACYRERF